MEVLQRTKHKVVVRQRRPELLRSVGGCLMLTVVFYLLDARHPKSSLYCARHAVLPNNDLEAEDIDCSLVVRPTRTALDLTFFEEISYSFEIASARLVRPPKRPTLREKQCLDRCPPGKACVCESGGRGARGRLHHKARVEKEEEKDGGDGAGTGVEMGDEERKSVAHHAMHMGVKDVATLVLEDNEGITYDFYTFQDEIVAEHMLEKVQGFIREARGEGMAAPPPSPPPLSTLGEAAEIDHAPLELEVLYDDSWLDETACGLFLIAALVLMALPYSEVVQFDAETGAMALDRWNLYQCGVFRYSCALENVSKLEITEGMVYMMSAHAFEHLRQTKEYGLRVLLSLPVHPGRKSSSPLPNANAPVAATAIEAPGVGAISSSGTGIGHAEASAAGASFPPTGSRRRRWDVFFGGRRPMARRASGVGGFLYLDLLFGRKASDNRKLRGPVELVNDLLQRFANDTEVAGGCCKREGASDGRCCVCFRRRSRVVTFPCMHMATCPQCSESLSACPLCRASISEKHTVFL